MNTDIVERAKTAASNCRVRIARGVDTAHRPLDHIGKVAQQAQAEILDELADTISSLRQEVETLQRKLLTYESGICSPTEAEREINRMIRAENASLRQEVETLREALGRFVAIDDSKDRWLCDVIEEAGASPELEAALANARALLPKDKP